jgi:hypothetical protein
VSATFWPIESIYFDRREFSQHSLYNDSFQKMRDNLRLFVYGVSSKPVDYYGFGGEYLYQTTESLEASTLSCDFNGYNIGINEIVSYDVLKRQWNEIYDLTQCVLDSIKNEKRHLSSDALSCLTWGSGKSGYKYDTNTISWPISWEEMDCSVSEVSGNILGVLPQHWTFNQLRCERPNAPTFNELVCDVLENTAIDTWLEMRDNEYTWNNTMQLSTIPLMYDDLRCQPIYGEGIKWTDCGWVENPSPHTWKNLNCCLSSYNVLPYDFFNSKKTPDKYAWSNLTCDADFTFTFSEVSCIEASASPTTWDALNDSGYTWETLECSSVSAKTYEQLSCGVEETTGAPTFLSWNYFACTEESNVRTEGVIYFDDIMYIENDCL